MISGTTLRQMQIVFIGEANKTAFFSKGAAVQFR